MNSTGQGDLPREDPTNQEHTTLLGPSNPRGIQVCGASSTKSPLSSGIRRHRRRTKAEVSAICDMMYQVLKEEHPCPVRHVFYMLTSTGLISKTESEYNHTVVRLLARMRLLGRVPFNWVSDSTRWMRKPRTWDSLQDAFESTARVYRRALWNNQPDYVEIWCEKDAIASTLYEETQRWDVPLMVNRGQPSLSFLHEAAQGLRSLRKRIFLYYLGDSDKWGHGIERKTEERLRQFAPDVEMHFERLAVTDEQIARWSLPTRPSKKGDDRKEVVEVDAVSPTLLRQLVRDAIQKHIDPAILQRTLLIEEEERESFSAIARTMKAII